ncbi:MAG: pitrilysin family protein [Chitinophagaceae bacterium]|jgi:predicted Zn-dependent peptidase|nr:pitrilysin family protein [Chitinophagaceae bacterium]
MSINRKIAPPILNATDFTFQLADITQAQLANGMPFYYLNAGAQEVVNIELVFDAGTWQQHKPGVAQAAASLLKNGTTKKTALEINELIEFYGANLKCGASNDFANVNISCMSKHLHHLLPLLFELLTESIFPEHELEIYKQTTIQRMQVSLKKSDFVANRKIDEYLFGYHHPYGFYNNISDIQAIETKDLREYILQYYSFDNCKIFLSGKFNDGIIKDVETIFGSSKWNDSDAIIRNEFTVTPAEQKKYRITNDENGVQGSVRMSMPFIKKAHPDFAPMIIVNTLFGGYFGSRLMSNIREDKGYTYGIYSYLYNNKHEGAFGISTEAGKDVCEATVQEIYKEIEILKTEPVDTEELQLVKNYILGGLVGDLDGPFQIMQRWKNLLLFGFDKSRFDSNIEIYKTITPAQIQELANRYFIADNFYELVVV